MPLPPDEPDEEEKLEEEPNDFDTPFSLPAEREVDIADASGKTRRRPDLESTHPATDSNLQDEELYDEGLSGAAEVSEPNPNDAVIAYHPRKKHK
ncbi:MAG TPA: hypothetical protein VN778_02010 [Verrucomicrobiae bacterium]|nr:hypothetical protein [Verrucomicrobiae bacterium]